MHDLNIESLARAIHEDTVAAAKAVGFVAATYQGGKKLPLARTFDELDEVHKALRREQARLMLERIMR